METYKAIFSLFSNREIALTIWFVLFVIFSFLGKIITIHNLIQIVELIISVFKISIPYVLFSISIIIAIIYSELLNFEQIKTILFWQLFPGLILFFKAHKINASTYFKGVFLKIFSLAFVFYFLVSFKEHNFLIEFFLIIPLSGIIYEVLESIEKKSKFKSIVALLFLIFTVLGLLIFNLFNTITLFILIIPIILTILYFPFYYAFSLFLKYEQIYKRLLSFQLSKTLMKKVLFQIVCIGGINLKRLDIFNLKIRHYDLCNSFSTKEYLLEVIGKQTRCNDQS